MQTKYLTALLIAASVASALNAGVFFAFSSFVMSGLGRIPAAQGIGAMKSINIVVLNPVFLSLFMGTPLLGLLLGGWSLAHPGEPAARLILAASLLLIVGCFGVTVAFNVPLNDRLAALDPSGDTSFWQHYLRTWTAWNHVRTVAPAVSAILYALAALRL